MIYIITNLSSKTKRIAGEPYCMINGLRKKILADKVSFDNNQNPFFIEFGYRYSENRKSRNVQYENAIYPNSKDDYYIYKVPIWLNGTGKLKGVSKRYYVFYSLTRRIGNNLFFLLGILILAIIFKEVFL